MENKFARLISYILHPLLMPLYSFILLFNMNAYFASNLGFQEKLIILALVLVSTFLFPSVLTFFMYKRKLVSSMHLLKREERNIPLIFTIIFFYGAYYMLRNTGIPPIFLLIMLSSTLMVILIFFINLKFKISVHTTSISALCGILMGISYRFQINLLPLIFLSILAAGFSGYSRLAMNAHSKSEVYYGYLAGFASMFLLFMFA